MHFGTDKDDLYTTVFAELKQMGIKVPKVKKFKSNILKQEKIVQPSKSKIFGVNLADQEWTSDCDYVLPKFIVSSVTYLRQHLNKVGLFRKAGSNVRQRELRLKLEKGEDLFESEPNDVASLLKQWLRELPEPLIPQYMHDLFIRCQQLDNDENKITAILLTCLLLPPNHLHTLKYLLCFLADFAANSHENMMGAHNLALCVAPNIFVSSDSSDKSCTNLVHIHASIIQLLIENALKIGSIPETVTFQYSLQDVRSCSELDSSGDFLDTVSSKRKKQKNGHVQDLLSGIKKLVGQNSASTTNAKTPEKYWNSHATAPRSASKREADTDIDSVLPLKKQPKLSVDLGNPNVTPKDKGIMNFGTVSKSGGHIRKKSFGLLRKKERKRQKSCHGNPLPIVTFSVTCPKNQTEEAVNCNNLTKPMEESIPPVSDNKNFKLSKSESMKKTASDSYLTPKYGKHHRLSLSSPKNSDVKFEIPAYFLRPKKTDVNMEHSTQNEPMCTEAKDKNNECETVISPKKAEIQNIGIFTKPVSEEKKLPKEGSKDNEISKVSKILVQSETPFRPKIQEMKSGGACKKVSSKGVGTQKVGSRGISGLGKRASSSELGSKSRNKLPPKNKHSRTDLRSISDSQIKQGSRRSVRKSPNCDKSRSGGLSRNEAFIVKPKKPRKNSLGLPKSVPDEATRASKKSNSSRVRNESSTLKKSLSLNSETGDKTKLSKNGTKRASRNGSLIRGRPNTVKTGLRCELRGNESILVSSESNEKRRSFKMNKNDVETNESCNLVENNKENKTCHELNPVISEPRDKRRSIKMNKINEIVETNKSCSPAELNNGNKRSNDSCLASESREKRKSLKMNKKDEFFEANESCVPMEINEENQVLNKTDTSLNTRFENFRLSSPVNSSESLIDFINSMFSSDDKPLSQEQLEIQNLSIDQNRMSPRLSMDKHRRASLQLKRDRSSQGSASKIPRLRSSLENKTSLPEITPESKRKVSKSRVSESSSASSSKIPTRKPDSSFDTFDISSLQISLNDSCFKTPDSNYPVSNSINWVSGSKYLGISSPQEDACNNKRESIALILKNNPGHVQAKVSMYDTRVRQSVVCTRSVPTFSTPFEQFDNRRGLRSSQKKHKKLHDSRSYDSAENFNRKKNKMRSPYPPPPKFYITDTSTPSHPLCTETTCDVNESQSSVKDVSFKDENCFTKKSSGNIILPLKESTNPILTLNDSENSFNLSVKDQNNISKRSMENVSHPLKEVTNISFEMKSPLIKDGYILSERVLSPGKKQKKLKRSSFTAKSPHKRSKRVSRSESSPGRPRPNGRMQNSSMKSAFIGEEYSKMK